jgi:glucose/arabinose dehydrogenase
VAAAACGLALTLGAGDAGAQNRAPGSFFRVVQRAAGLNGPIGIANAGDGTPRLFILEQGGRIRLFDGTQILPTPFLDLSSIVLSGGEQGLLGLAFHPDYETNGYFYVNYTCRGTAPACSGGGFGAGDSVLARYRVSANPNVADPTSAQILTVIDDPFTNHNGGNLQFGPDGYLYWGLGDGGSGDDQCEYAQNLLWDFVSTGNPCINTNRTNRRTFWGKMLRLDVNQNINTAPFYGIPPTNPWTATGDPGDPSDLIPDEIWAYGLRNPWRFSFDRTTGDLWVADVGQNLFEEVNFLPWPPPATGTTWRNYGWDVLEGFNCHENQPAGSCANFLNGQSQTPAFDYPRSDGSTVIGGFVYRGRPVSNLISANYIFADYGSSHFWRAIRVNGAWQKIPLFDYSGATGFGEDVRGRLFFVGAFNGTLNQIVPHTFADVQPSVFPYPYVEALYEAQVTGGCGGDAYCPNATVTRGEMAVFLLRTRFGSTYTPPACSNATFSDVPCSDLYAPWIYDLVARGVTSGCGNGAYCPQGAVTREQMAVFLLRTAQGPAYTPPDCTTPSFGDVPCSSGFSRWIEELVRRNITGGCGNGNFCPAAPVTRGEMAVFLVVTFGLIPV